MENPKSKWTIWGYPYFQRNPRIVIHAYPSVAELCLACLLRCWKMIFDSFACNVLPQRFAKHPRPWHSQTFCNLSPSVAQAHPTSQKWQMFTMKLLVNHCITHWILDFWIGFFWQLTNYRIIQESINNPSIKRTIHGPFSDCFPRPHFLPCSSCAGHGFDLGIDMGRAKFNG